MAHKVISERIPNSLQWIYSSAKDGKSPTRESPPSVCDKVHPWQIFFLTQTTSVQQLNIDAQSPWFKTMWKVFVWLESSESGWQEDRWVGRCCRTNELFSHRNNFHGKIPQTIVLSPIQANIWCSFCRSVSSSSMGAIKAHIGPNIHIYMSTLHCPQCPGVHINSLQKGCLFECPFYIIFKSSHKSD